MATITSLSLSRYGSFSNGSNASDLSAEVICRQASYDGCRWWSKISKFCCKKASPKRILEFQSVFSTLKQLFPDVSTMEDYCIEHAEDLRNGHEYNLYWNGTECNYWIHCNTKPSSVNLSVHAIEKT